MSFEEIHEFLDAAYENGQIQQKANAKNLMDYGPLDEMLKTNPFLSARKDRAPSSDPFPFPR
jgi:hypothetical protein